MDKGLSFNNSVLKGKVRLSWNLRTSTIIKQYWKPLIFQDFRHYWKNGLQGFKYICHHRSSRIILNMLRIWKALSWVRLSFLFKLYKSLGCLKTTWRRRVIGRTGLSRSLNRTSLLSWEGQRNTQRKCL